MTGIQKWSEFVAKFHKMLVLGGLLAVFVAFIGSGLASRDGPLTDVSGDTMVASHAIAHDEVVPADSGGNLALLLDLDTTLVAPWSGAVTDHGRIDMFQDSVIRGSPSGYLPGNAAVAGLFDFDATSSASRASPDALMATFGDDVLAMTFDSESAVIDSTRAGPTDAEMSWVLDGARTSMVAAMGVVVTHIADHVSLFVLFGALLMLTGLRWIDQTRHGTDDRGGTRPHTPPGVMGSGLKGIQVTA